MQGDLRTGKHPLSSYCIGSREPRPAGSGRQCVQKMAQCFPEGIYNQGRIRHPCTTDSMGRAVEKGDEPQRGTSHRPRVYVLSGEARHDGDGS